MKTLKKILATFGVIILLIIIQMLIEETFNIGFNMILALGVLYIWDFIGKHEK